MPKSFIEKLRALSEKQKIVIIITVVVIAGLIMGYFWVKNAMKSVSQIGQAVKSVDLPKIDLPQNAFEGLPGITDVVSPSDEEVINNQGS